MHNYTIMWQHSKNENHVWISGRVIFWLDRKESPYRPLPIMHEMLHCRGTIKRSINGHHLISDILSGKKEGAINLKVVPVYAPYWMHAAWTSQLNLQLWGVRFLQSIKGCIRCASKIIQFVQFSDRARKVVSEAFHLTQFGFEQPLSVCY